jgi:hypothetical protein
MFLHGMIQILQQIIAIALDECNAIHKVNALILPLADINQCRTTTELLRQAYLVLLPCRTSPHLEYVKVLERSWGGRCMRGMVVIVFHGKERVDTTVKKKETKDLTQKESTVGLVPVSSWLYFLGR